MTREEECSASLSDQSTVKKIANQSQSKGTQSYRGTKTLAVDKKVRSEVISNNKVNILDMFLLLKQLWENIVPCFQTTYIFPRSICARLEVTIVKILIHGKNYEKRYGESPLWKFQLDTVPHYENSKQLSLCFHKNVNVFISVTEVNKSLILVIVSIALEL